MGAMPDASEERRKRVRSTIRLAAQYVARKDEGEPVHWVPAGRVTRLDAEGKPTGAAPMRIGPIIFSVTPEKVDEDLVRTMFGIEP